MKNGIELIESKLKDPKFQLELAKLYVTCRLHGKKPYIEIECRKYHGDSFSLESLSVGNGWNNFYDEVEKAVPNFIIQIQEFMEYYDNEGIHELEVSTDDELNSEVLYFIFDLKEKEFIFNHEYYYYVTDYRGTTTEFEEIEGTSSYDDIMEFCSANKQFKVDFNGGGDSGYIESHGYNENGERFEVPASIEDKFYIMLSDDFGGWEINEGSQGSFTIDCEAKTIQLEIGLNEESSESNEVFRSTIEFDVNILKKRKD